MQAAPSTVTFLRSGGEVMPMNEILVIISLATAVVSFMAAMWPTGPQSLILFERCEGSTD